LVVLLLQEAAFGLAIGLTGALPLGVRELHSAGSILAFALGSLSAALLLSLAGLAWLSVINLVPLRPVRRVLSFCLYLAVYLPLYNLGFYLFSRHLADAQLLRDAPSYFRHAPAAHLFALAVVTLVYLSLTVLSWRRRLFGEAFRDSSTEGGHARSRESFAIALAAVASLALSSGLSATHKEFAPAMSTAAHLTTGYLPNVHLAFLPVGRSRDAFLADSSPVDSSLLLKVKDVDTYLRGLRDKTPAARPNILVVMLESVPVDHVSAYGYRRPTTPNLDRLAAQSLVFDRCYAVANESKHGQTSIHTSTLPMRGRNDDFAEVGYWRLPWWTVFKILGYRTLYISTQNEDWLHMKNFQLQNQVPPDVYVHAPDIPEGPSYEGLLRKKDEATVNRRLFSALDQAKADGRPFILVTNYQRTHYPFELPEDYVPPFAPVAKLGEFGAWKEADIPAGINTFDSALAYVDKHLGDLVRYLDDSGLGANTIVAVLSDHGISFEPGVQPLTESLKASSIHVPFLLRYPEKLAPGHFAANVSTIDLYPTLLGLLGAPANPAWQGRDVLLLGAAGCARRPVFAGSIIWLQRWLAIGEEGKVLLDLDERGQRAFAADDRLLAHDLVDPPWAAGLARLLSSTLRHHIRFYETKALHAQHMLAGDSGGTREGDVTAARSDSIDLDLSLRVLLMRSGWYFEKQGVGRLRMLTFRRDGRIRSLGLPDHPAESFWEVDGGELRFLDQNREVSTRFSDLSVSGGVFSLRGLHHGDETDVRVLRQVRMGGSPPSRGP